MLLGGLPGPKAAKGAIKEAQGGASEAQGGALGDPTSTLARKLAWLRDVEVSWTLAIYL